MRRGVASSSRHRSGQSIIELMAGLVVLVPVALFLLDLGVLVLSNQIADTNAKNAARAAANQPTKALAEGAAAKALERYKDTGAGFVKSLKVQDLNYVPDDRVAVTTLMEVELPVPVPFGLLDNKPKFVTQAVEPIVTKSTPP